MEVKHVAAGHGWLWLKQGYALFIKSPLLWMVLLMICFIGAAGVSLVPVVGQPLVSLLTPVIMAGLMAGCRTLEEGEELELAHLFSGFQNMTNQLVTLGGITLVAQYLIFGVMIAVGGGALVTILMSGEQPPDPNAFAQIIAGAGISVMIGIVLFIVLLMAMQFAPMLVYFNKVAPIAALKLSLSAFLANVGAIFVYDMIFIGLAIIASIPMMLGWLVLIPVMITSIYACYRDIFPPVAIVSAEPPQADDPFKPEQGTF
jgi:uncharacterized membrane protein